MPTSAAEDPRDAEAGRHYERGQRLHNEGLFQEAITEFRAAYRIKPHPNVLYNIGQAYERLLEYQEAVSWFELYLREGGEAAPYRVVVNNRLRVLRGLPARIHVECVPQATASLVDTDGVVERAPTPAEFRVKAGRYTLRVTKDGYVPQERRIGAEIGQPYFYQFTLEQQRELVTVRTNPAQARIFLDQKLVTTNPYADRLPVGPHKLHVEYEKHEPYAGDFTLRPGRKIEFEIVLKPPPPQGRLEFVFGTGVYGGAVLPLVLYTAGVLTDDTLSGKRGLVLLPMIVGGGAVGALAGFFLTPRGIREANSALILGGTTWGGMEGFSLGLLADRRNTRLTAGLTLAGSAAGMAAGLLLMRPLNLTPGQAAIINSGGIWGSGLGLGLGYALRGDRRDLNLTLIIGLNIGLITSGVLVNHFDLSRTRMLIIDIGTLAGAATGTLLGYVASQTDPFKSNIGKANLARGGLVGGAVGLGTAIILTRNYDRRGKKGTIARDSLIALEGKSLNLGMPAPEIVQVPRPGGESGLQVTLKLASGTF